MTLRKHELRPLLIGAAALVAIIIGAFFAARLFFEAYLYAWLFFLGVALGSLGLLMTWALTGGKWGEAVHTPLVAAIWTLPLLAVLFIPILAGVRTLYPWTASGVAEAKSVYLNIPFFIGRAVLYFACWIALGFFYTRRWERSRWWAGGGLVLYIVTMTFAAWDWMMSLEPAWWSTIYSMIVITAQGLSAMAVMILVVSARQPRDDKTMLDLGNLLLAFLIFWTYCEFSQFLLIWSGNIKDEIPWYLTRLHPPWLWLAAWLAGLFFFAPFLALLFRATKRNPILISAVALLLLGMRFADLLWTIAPAVHPLYLVSWMDVVAPFAIGGVWIAAFRWLLRHITPEISHA
ncbi:MAG TPA: hypothetical protein VKH35_11575 [Thermoanaerobaculia bacterium]|nr:hypothetical protein [Thermoanaerobaculia bacterium]